MIGLVDADNFFVSCERSLNPALHGVPVVVLSNNDGCVISRSNEVKQLGLPMGAPYWQYRDVIKQHDIQVLSVNFDLYQHLSARIVSVLEEECVRVQVYSIDESFVAPPVFELVTDLAKWAVGVTNRIAKVTCIPVSIGIAPSKTLAKLAGQATKDRKKINPDDVGVTVMASEEIRDYLSNVYIGSVWGIGSRLAHRMRLGGVKTALDLICRPDDWVRSQFGIVGLRIKYELSGLSSSAVKNESEPRKGIASTRSFGSDVYSFQDLQASILRHVQIAARKLRRQQSVAGSIRIFIRTGKHRTGPHYYGKQSSTFLVPTDDTLVMNQVATQMLRSIYCPGIRYYRSGVSLSEIEPAENYYGQSRLFTREQVGGRHKVMEVIDDFQARYGEDIIRTSCIPPKPKWLPKKQYSSYSQSFKNPDKLPTLDMGEGVESYW